MSATSSEDTVVNDHMISSRRWEKREGHCNRYGWRHFEDAVTSMTYTTFATAYKISFSQCFLYNVQLTNCSLYDCHVHFSVHTFAQNCYFSNCIITTNSRAIIDVGNRTKFHNCTVRGNFVRPTKIDIQDAAEDPITTQLAPFDVYNNVVLKDCIIDKLRKWVWRYRKLKIGTHPRRLGPWRGKEASKRPVEVSELYDAEEQLELPERRALYSLKYTTERKQKHIIDLTWMDVDD